MKHIVLKITLLLITISILSCQKQNKGYVLSGYIENLPDSAKINLYSHELQEVINVAYAMAGHFEMTGKVDKPTWCWLQTDNDFANIMIENTMIILECPEDSRLNYCEIHGGKEQTLLNELKKQQYPYDKIWLAADDSINKYFSSDPAKSEEFYKEYKEYSTKSHKVYIDFGKAHPNTYLGIDILYRNRFNIDRDSLIAIYANLTEEFKESRDGLALKVFLDERLAVEGEPMIDFQAKTIDSLDFTLSSLKGKYIYLTFWSSTCAPCRSENKYFSQNIDKIPENLELVSFSVDNNIKNWRIASEKDGIQWTNISDYKGDKGAIKTRYQVQAIPTSYLIDDNGIIVKKFLGFGRCEDLITNLEALMKI